jgi:hypothetical protein
MAASTWLVNPLTGVVAHITNGIEADTLELAGWKAFTTQAAAEAWAKQNPVSRVAGGVSGQASAVANAAGDVLGLPQLSNLRNLVIRGAKVIVGLLLIAIGAVKLLHIEDAAKEVAPIVAKGAMI